VGRRARYGRAEQTLAKALKGRRDRAIIATKIWTSSPSEGREQANHALRLFGRVEIYQVHNQISASGWRTNWGEISRP
jgi:aryl-alcohol dehydrogenase-like predicted oxidoreductase